MKIPNYWQQYWKPAPECPNCNSRLRLNNIALTLFLLANIVFGYILIKGVEHDVQSECCNLIKLYNDRNGNGSLELIVNDTLLEGKNCPTCPKQECPKQEEKLCPPQTICQECQSCPSITTTKEWIQYMPDVTKHEMLNMRDKKPPASDAVQFGEKRMQSIYLTYLGLKDTYNGQATFETNAHYTQLVGSNISDDLLCVVKEHGNKYGLPYSWVGGYFSSDIWQLNYTYNNYTTLNNNALTWNITNNIFVHKR